jgi:membrane associated rhomboid family serine protease
LFIIPFNRENQVRNPWVVILLIAINVGWYFVSLAAPDFQQFERQFGYIPAEPHLVAIFTSMFTHAGFWHVAGNMWFLWMFGNQVENSLGIYWFSLAYLSSGLTALAAFVFFEPSLTIPLVGASGAVSGVVGTYVILYPNNQFDLDIYFGRFLVKTIPCTAKLAVGAWFAEQLLWTAISRFVPMSTAFAAHVGGFGFGILAGLAFKVVVSEEKQAALASSDHWQDADDADALVTLDLSRAEKPRKKSKSHSAGARSS